MGRPALVLSEILERRIVDAVERGATRTCAAQAAGVARSTLFKWLAAGRAGDGRFAEFADRIARAEATAELAMSDRLFESGRTDGRFALEWLARRRAKSWGKRDAANVVSRSGSNDAARMSEEGLRARLVELTAEAMADPDVAALVDEEVRRRKEA